MAITTKDAHIQTFYGLSTDSKPTAPTIGSTFYEEDTETTYRYMGTWQAITTLADLDTAFNKTGFIAATSCSDTNYHEVETPSAASAKLALYQFEATDSTLPFIIGISYDDGAHWSDDYTVQAGKVFEILATFTATAFRFKKSTDAVSVQGKYYYKA